MERTLVLIKPYGVKRGLIGKVVDRFEREGMRIVGLKLMRMDEALGLKHYAAHVDKPFFPALMEYMTSGPIAAMVVEGEGVIDRVRTVMGATNPAKAAPGTIRAEWAVDVTRNLVHGSDSPDSARTEIALFFTDDELFEYDKVVDGKVGS